MSNHNRQRIHRFHLVVQIHPLLDQWYVHFPIYNIIPRAIPRTHTIPTWSWNVSWFIGPRTRSSYQWTESCFQLWTGIDCRPDGELHSTSPLFLLHLLFHPCFHHIQTVRATAIWIDADWTERIDLVNVAFWYVPCPINTLPFRLDEEHFQRSCSRRRRRPKKEVDAEWS